MRAVAVKAPRRAIFIDVENTSNEAELIRVIEELEIDRAAQPTEVMAVGNWRSVGQAVARTLAKLGAQLVHSAPTTGVRDWSDLWIAVTAGRWLGTASPGDVLEIVSDDRAFDAVGDAAAIAGVSFTRVPCRRRPEPTHPAEAAAAPKKSRRGGRRRHRPRETSTAPHAPAPRPHTRSTPAHPPLAVASPEPVATSAIASEVEDYEEAHGASAEQIRSAITRLCGGDSSRWINLDALANTLKTEGFVRPPGSPRLVTRLRKMKDVEIHPNGTVRLRPEGTAGASDSGDEAEVPEAAATAGSEAGNSTAARRRRRGGRKRRRRPSEGAPAAEHHATRATPSEVEHHHAEPVMSAAPEHTS